MKVGRSTSGSDFPGELATYSFLRRDEIGLGVAEDMAHMQDARHGRRRRVDHEGLRAGQAFIPRVHSVLLPLALPAFLGFLVIVLFGQGFHIVPE